MAGTFFTTEPLGGALGPGQEYKWKTLAGDPCHHFPSTVQRSLHALRPAHPGFVHTPSQTPVSWQAQECANLCHIHPQEDGLERAYVMKFQDIKCLEHGLKAGKRTLTKSGYVSLTLGPHGAVG